MLNLTFVQTKDVSSDTTGIRGINFNPDGTRMYITNREDDLSAYIIEYSLTTPFDISTATISFKEGDQKELHYTNGQMINLMQLNLSLMGQECLCTTNEIGSFSFGV